MQCMQTRNADLCPAPTAAHAGRRSIDRQLPSLLQRRRPVGSRSLSPVLDILSFSLAGAGGGGRGQGASAGDAWGPVPERGYPPPTVALARGTTQRIGRGCAAMRSTAWVAAPGPVRSLPTPRTRSRWAAAGYRDCLPPRDTPTPCSRQSLFRSDAPRLPHP